MLFSIAADYIFSINLTCRLATGALRLIVDREEIFNRNLESCY